MSKKTFNVILAISPTFGIGYKNQLPWRLSADLKNLKTITSDPKLFNSSSENKQNAVIMGRKTYESLPEKFRPLPNRLNIVLSKSGCASLKKDKSVLICDSLDNSLLQIEQELSNKIENIFVLGGAQVFDESLAHPYCEQVFLTKVGVKYECDRFISPKSLSKFSHLETSRTYIENETPFIFQRLFNPNRVLSNSIINKRLYETHEEFQYLSLIRDIINQGNERSDRTNTGTLSKFGGMMRYNLQHGFPLLTTKEVFWRGVVEELLWFIRGETNGKKLSEKNVKIWDPNGSRQFLDNLGLIHREEGDLGPVYGFQWRHFGAEYIDMHSNYEGKGVDQLMGLIERIKTDPSSRRLIMNAWNPVDLPKMALPPCHVMTQFYVQEGKLSCIMYQRSADIGLGVPFNIASYALLTCLIAHICGLERGEFIHFLGDYHVYKNHVEQLKEQIERIPGPFPFLKIKNKRDKIDQFIFEDFELLGYNPQKKIKMKMAV